MSERLILLEHHVDGTLKRWSDKFRNSPNNISQIINEQVIPEVSKPLRPSNIDDYAFLRNNRKRKLFSEALKKATMAYLQDKYITIPDRRSDGERNFDIICQGCGNFINGSCILEEKDE
jgi:hypothetical protein